MTKKTYDIWELIAKKLSNETTPEEENLLEDCSDQDEAVRKLTAILPTIRIRPNVNSSRNQLSFDRIRQQISDQKENNNDSPKIKDSIYKYWAVAATLLLVIACGFFFISEQQRKEAKISHFRIVNNPYGEQKHVVLPDGSNVWMNAGSQLIFPEKFMPGLREVVISGEAFFDIQTDINAPFIVQSENTSVKVLGTRFNVRSYYNEDVTEITLESGSISLNVQQKDMPNAEHPFLLLPDQRAEISKATGNVLIENTDSEMYTAWKEGKLRFKAKTFEEIAQILERKYNTKIEIKSERLKNEIFTTKFDNGESLERILDVFQLNTIMSYSYKNNKYIITERRLNN